MYKHKDCVGISVLWRLHFSFCQEENKATLFPVLTFCSLCWDILKRGYFWGLSHPCMDFFHPVICTYWDAMLRTGSPILQSSSSALKWVFCKHSSFVTCFCQWSGWYRIAWDGFFCFYSSWNIIRGAEFGATGGCRTVVGSVTQPSTHQLLAHCPLQWVGERIRKEKTELGGWNKDKNKRWCKDRLSPLPISRSLSSGSFGKISTVLLLRMMFYGVEQPLISLGHCLLCVPSQPPAHPQDTCWGDRLRNRRSGSCVSPVWQ